MLNNIIDLSHHNTVTSFEEAKLNGIVGVLHKATQGRTVVDATYHARRARALANGLLWGAYHFGVKGNVAQQVEHFLNTVNPADTDLLVLDFEPNHESDTMTLPEAEEFVALVKEKVGRFPALYSGQSFLRQRLGTKTDTVLSNCFLWIARYSSELPIVPPTWETFQLWQYTDGNAGPQPHQVPGIGRCDRNKFNGDIAGLKRLWGIRERNDISPREMSLLATEADAVEATMSEAECSIWRGSDVRMRIRNAVAQWAKVSPSVIVSSQKLKELVHPDDGPWSIAQQNNLITVTNNQNPPIFHSVIPEDDQCEMDSLNNLISGDTTVLEWEGIVWTNQEPETFCKRMFG